MNARLAVVYEAQPGSDLLSLAKALARGLGIRTGFSVDVLELSQCLDRSLTPYSYLAFGCTVRSWFKGRLDPRWAQVLPKCGNLVGKKGFAFTEARLLGSQRTLLNLMKQLESQGLFLRSSEILSDETVAEAVGQELKV